MKGKIDITLVTRKLGSKIKVELVFDGIKILTFEVVSYYRNNEYCTKYISIKANFITSNNRQ